MYKKVAVLGDRDSIYGFSALGLNLFFAERQEEVKKYFLQLCSQDYAVVFITENATDMLNDEIEEVSSRLTPSVILIPGIKGNTGQGMKSLKRAVEKAVGSDILMKDK